MLKRKRLSLLLLSILMLVCILTGCGKTVEINVNFVVDGETYHTISTTGEDPITMPQDPTKEGYVFEGWYWDDNTFQKPFTANSLLDQKLSDDMSVYAKWTLEDITKKNYDLTFNSMGGSEVETQSILYGNVASAPTNPTKTGYIFVGWYKEADFTTKWNFSADTVTQNTTLYAKWVSENDAQGSEIIEAPSFEINDKILSMEIPNAQEHIVVSELIKVSPYATYKVTTDIEGKNEIPSGTVPVMAGDNVFYILVTSGTGSNKTQYTVNVHRRLMLNVTYEFNNGSESVVETFEEDSKITTKDASKNGYTFVEWQYNDEAWDFENSVILDNMTLEATYIANEYTVSFNSNGGNDVENATVTFDAQFEFEVPTKKGYSFDGWRTAQGDLLTNSLGECSSAWVIANDTALFAQWTPIGYEITYHNVDGATNNNMPTYDVEDEPLALIEASRTGYTFIGWYTDAEFLNPISEIAVGTVGNLDLYAKWETIEYTATFKDGNDVIKEITFTVETESIEAPDIPNHTGYNGAWENYTLGANDITVNAIYTPIVYTITYEGTKGVANSNPISYTIESATITLADISATGYTFNGWYNGSTKVTEIAQGSTGNITLTADWSAVVYTITYEGTKDVANSNPISYTIESATITLADISATGYTFNGWYNGSTKVTEIAQGTTGNITLTADWSAVVYTITYEGTKGVANSNPISYTIESATITLADISATGYTFNGWYNGSTKVTEIAQGSTGDITLTADWTAIRYNITYMYDAEIGDYPNTNKNPATYTIEDDFDFIALVNKTTGYTFDGWYTEKNVGTGTKVTGIEAGSTGSITIYAHWALDEYEITYHNADGITNTNATTYTIETDTFSIYDVSKDGYVFNGWYSDSAFSNKVTEIAKGTTGNIDLYAKWTPIQYTIDYVLYGGVYSDENNPVNYTIEDTLSFVAPELSGYTFVGFFTLAEGGNLVTGIEEGTTGNKTFYARYIAFNTNGGTEVEYNFSIENNTISKPSEPQMEYYTFDGWYIDEALTQEFDFSIPSKTLILYAKFVPTIYKITYILNGGTHPEGQVFEYTVSDTTVTLLNPTKTGYTFVGWFTDDKFTSSVVTELKNAHGDKTFYANYSINQYTISFETNGGTEVEAITQNYATSVSAPSDPAKNGYKFAGWYSDSALKKEYFFTTIPAEDITVYAKWTIETYNITYNLEGGTNNKNNPSTFNVQSQDIILRAPTKAGYNFAGWYSDSDYTSAITKIATGSYGNIEVFAKWEIITYTITYVTNENTENTNPLTYTVETDLTNLADATLKGHTFGGWYKDISYNERVYQFGGGEMGDITLYAKFTANTYDVWLDGTDEASFDVSFDLNGAAGSISKQTVTETNLLSYPTVPTRDGYVFGGWYSNSACEGNLYDFTALITGDITLYAKWVKVENSITINTNRVVTLNGREEQKFTFIPLVSGNVTFTTTGSYDTLGILYDENGNILKMDDDTGSDGVNFQIVFNVTAGEVYTISVSSYSSATSGQATLYVSGDSNVLAGGYVIAGNKTQVTYGKDFVIPLPDAKDGYKFLGWADRYGEMYTDATGASVKPWDKDETTLLVSVWERTVYTITFITSGGTTIDTVSLAYGERLDISKYVTTRDNYTFDCWMIDGVAFNATTMPDHNITLTAKWKTFSLGEIKYDETKLAISVNDEITADLFGAICIDTNGNKAEFTVTVNGTQAAGETITVRLVATSGGKTKQITITGIKVYGNPSLTFDETVDYVNIEGGLTASHFNAIAIDSFGEYATIEVAINGEYEAGDIVTVVIKAIDVAGNVTEGYVYNVKAYGLPNISYDEDKTAISVNDKLDADFFEATAKDSFGATLDVTIDLFVNGVDTKFVNGDVCTYTTSTSKKYTYFPALNSETYSLYYKNGASGDRTYISVYCVTTNTEVVAASYYTNYSSYGTMTFDVIAGYEYYICTYAYSSSYTTDFSMYLESATETFAEGLELTVKFSATDSKGNTSNVSLVCDTYGTPTISDAGHNEIKVTDFISAELLEITATDTYGNILDVDVTVKSGTQTPGTTMVITAKAIDAAGNVATKDVVIKIYGTPTIIYDRDAVKVTEDATTCVSVVTFDLNGGKGSIASQTVVGTTGLEYPSTIPTRSGYAFKGWYSDSSCTELYDFRSNISNDITLYAGWEAMTTSYYSRNYLDIYNGYNSDSNCYSSTNSGTSSSSCRYAYFTALKDGTYTIYYKNSNSSSSYGTYVYIYNATQQTVIKSSSNVYSTSYASKSFTAKAGDVIYVKFYRYNTSYSATFSMYVTGGNLPSDGGISINPAAERVLNAYATDSFGNPLIVTATLKSGTLSGGNYVVYTLTATDKLGNSHSIDTEAIGVYDIADILDSFTYNQYMSDLVKISSDGSEFDASAIDSFGNACTITVESADGSALVGGSTASIVIIATDKAGNSVRSEVISNIKIYGMPNATLMQENYMISENEDISFLFTVHDSFGEELYAEITTNDKLIAGTSVNITVKAEDIAGNVLEKTYVFYVVSETTPAYIELYVDDEFYQGLFADSLTDFTLPTVNKSGKSFYGWKDEYGTFYTDSTGTGIAELSEYNTLYAVYYTSGYTPIATESELRAISMTGKYALVSDIDLGGSEWKCKGYSSGFSGILDGNGYKISNFTITDTAYGAYLGFFYKNNGTIMNLGLTGYTITGGSSQDEAGAIAIYNNGQILNCYCSGSISVTTTSNVGAAGGVCYSNKGVIYNTYVTGSVRCTSSERYCEVGGFVVSNSGVLINCVAANSVYCTITNTNYKTSCRYGGLIASSSTTSAINCYVIKNQTLSGSGVSTNGKYAWSTTVAAADLKNIEWIKNNLWKTDYDAWNCENGYPILDHVYLDNEHTYQINTQEEFLMLNGQVLMGDYQLNCDVDLTGVTWIPMVNFGHFDGNGHTITNLTVTNTLSYAGLFGTNFGSIEQLGVSNININVSKSGEFGYGGGLVGQNFGKIANCYAKDGTVTFYNNGNGNYTWFASAGGLAGGNEGEIENCFTNLTVSAQNYFSACYAGGFVGKNNGTIKNSVAIGNVSALNTSTTSSGALVLAGFVASGNGTVSNCYCCDAQTFEATKAASSTTTREPSNTNVPTQTTETMYSRNLYIDTLKWDLNIWEILDGQLPVLRK